eukprot:TRINITY_DN3982_c0_g1_i1.p1 TRINITY_DN3982_c0_g1~~TRINITY_DN3982_c0_g1_i1.p1  ORF type:complete len:186 (+),score=40.70 TRINITY_DN3982_c0_g1_i1:83-640(+)
MIRKVVSLKFSAATRLVLTEARRVKIAAQQIGDGKQIKVVGPQGLPTKIKKFTVLKSPFKYKKFQEAFEIRTHSTILRLEAEEKLLNNFVSWALQTMGAGVDVRQTTFTFDQLKNYYIDPYEEQVRFNIYGPNNGIANSASSQEINEVSTENHNNATEEKSNQEEKLNQEEIQPQSNVNKNTETE